MTRIPTERSRDAVRVLMQPSVPQPLPGSQPVGAGQWLMPGTAADVLRGYAAASAPIPAGSTVWQESEVVLRVESPMRASAILVTEHSAGCVYTIAGSPTLQLEGCGVIADVEAFVRIGAAAYDPTGLGFITHLEIDGAPWTVGVLPNLSDTSVDPADTLRLYLAPRPLPASMDLDLSDAELQGPCQARAESGVIIATATITERTVVVRARITDALATILPAAPVTLTVSKKWGRHRSRPKLQGSGFQADEPIALMLGERKMSGATTDRHGKFEKGLQVPADFPIGDTEFRAAGETSGSVAAVPYEVREPK